MALVVEDGSGLSTAESYNSVAEITTYNAAHAVDATWIAAINADQERFARMAAQYIEATWGRAFQGSRSTTTQALSFPRFGVEVDGVCIPTAPLPRQLKEAHAELAIRAASGGLMPDQTAPGEIVLERVKVGPIETETQYGSGGKSQETWFRLVDALMAPLVWSSDELVRA